MSSAANLINFDPANFTKPADDFDVPALAPKTIFHLAIIRAHLDKYDIIGPVTAFMHLEKDFMKVFHNSPKGLEKLDNLRYVTDDWGEKEEIPEFVDRGFNTLVAEGQKDVYTILKVIRQVSKKVHEILPSPVYVVSAIGPLTWSDSPTPFLPKPGFRGYAANTTLIGSYATCAGAKSAAEDAMAKLTLDVKNAKIEASWLEGMGGGSIVAMVPGKCWEVKVKYEDEVFHRTLEHDERASEGGKRGYRT